MEKIYVASSWRNEEQAELVTLLREYKYEVYDFKHPNGPDSSGFGWSQIDPNWKNWSNVEYLTALEHPIANKGFDNDFNALQNADIVIFLAPCGVSAALEFGYACGVGKITIAYIPAMREPDLMIKMSDFIVTNRPQLLELLYTLQKGLMKVLRII